MEFHGVDRVNTDGIVYISYNGQDRDRVEPIALELRKLCVPVWFFNGIMPGSGWTDPVSVFEYLEKASFLVLFVTTSIFDNRNWLGISEYRFANMSGTPIVPVFLDNVTDKHFLEKIDSAYRCYVNDWINSPYVPYSQIQYLNPMDIAIEIKKVLDQYLIRKYNI